MATILETGSEAPTTTAVIEAIAEHEGVDPLDLDQPLYEVVDPDALDAIIDDGGDGGGAADLTVRFSYNGCRVQVSGDGSIEVAPSPVE